MVVAMLDSWTSAWPKMSNMHSLKLWSPSTYKYGHFCLILISNPKKNAGLVESAIKN